MPHSTYMRNRIGSAVIRPSRPVTAGGLACFDLIYTAGYFGIDDSGSIKIVHRFASDMAKPQFDDPLAPHYVSVEAGNGATLHYHYDVKNNIRPWGKTLYIKIVKGFFREGDQIIVRYGDRRRGCPGIRMQTFCEHTFEFKVLVDAFATYDYVELPESPTIAIVPGDPVQWRAVLPTMRRCGQRFRLAVKAEDMWGNPCDTLDTTVFLKSKPPINNLPDTITFTPSQAAAIIEDLSLDVEADVTLDVLDRLGRKLASSNPLRIVKSSELLPYWADLHGQSEETIGTNSARDYFEFGRDKAFLDATCHQGNDFQITSDFWAELQQLTAEFHEPGRFITFPGYEWSGNTGLGGDHNVIYFNEGEQIHRSCHALVYDLSDAHTDRHTTKELFETLKNKDVFIYAHVGGRYADLKFACDTDAPLAIEIHSAWGTFEWLLHDAFDLGMRVGIVANSDGHKGRPGASYPGASMFGSYGGLTCFLCDDLKRKSIFASLRRRRHYATTGARMFLDTRMTAKAGNIQAMMGDTLSIKETEAVFHVDALCSSPVERMDIFNGKELLETFRPFTTRDLGRRIRVIWEGAEYRGRGRETTWDGGAELSGNSFERVTPVNFWNLERPLRHQSPTRLSWESITTGGLSGFDALLHDAQEGTLEISTPLIQTRINVVDIGLEDMVFEAGGLRRRMRIFRMPDENRACRIELNRIIKLKAHQDNPVYVRLTQEDGHLAWSSPIYVRSE